MSADAKHFLFVGGGTGGHLCPAIGLAEQLLDRGHQVRFLTSGRSIEQAFFSKELRRRGVVPFSLGIDDSRWPRGLSLVRALWRVRQDAKFFRPHVIVSLGGLAGASALGARMQAPVVLLEGNRVAGRAVRMMQRFAEGTLTLFEETAKELRAGHWIGPIGRSSLKQYSQMEARRLLGLHSESQVLLVMGGSQGAQDLNRIAAGLVHFLAQKNIQLLALTGPGKAEELRGRAMPAQCAAVVLEHLEDMGLAYCAADLAISRGGAASIAELWMYHLPAVVLPYPYHKDRQQEHNAKSLGEGVRICTQVETAADIARECLEDPSRLQHMAQALQQQAPPEGSRKAVEFLEELAARKS